MEGLRTPVGDLPPEVYWRRRLTVVGGVVLVLVVVWFLATSPSGETDDPTADPTPSPSVTPDASMPPSQAQACTGDDVSVTLVANPRTFPEGALPTFEATIEHLGGAPCALNTAASTSDLYIRSGPDDIFYASHCPAQSPINEREFILSGGTTENFDVSWNRQRSAEDCATNTGDVRPGFYLATLTLQGISSDEAQFELTGE